MGLGIIECMGVRVNKIQYTHAGSYRVIPLNVILLVSESWEATDEEKTIFWEFAKILCEMLYPAESCLISQCLLDNLNTTVCI